MPDSRVIGSSPTDRLLGMLIERTEALREETSELRKATNGLRDISQEMRSTLKGVADRIEAVERLPMHDIAARVADCEATKEEVRATREKLGAVMARLGECESGVKDWRATRDKIVRYLVVAAILTLLAGGTAGITISNALRSAVTYGAGK